MNEVLEKTPRRASNRDKRKPKGPIKFKISLNEEQKIAKSIILNNTISVLAGKAGSGKTLLACQVALDMLFTRQVERIIISRPAVSSEDIGFIPGNIKDKMDPYLEPIYHNMYRLYDRNVVDKRLAEGIIEIGPIGFMRGKTFVDSFVIIDEAQNVTPHQMLTILTRVGKGTKLVVCGDSTQKDLRGAAKSGFSDALRMAHDIPSFGEIELQENHRAGIVDDVINWYSKKNR